jgi:hypothetical protein
MFARKISASVLMAFVTLITAAFAAGQDPRGTLTGAVTDASGAVLPGVSISVKNTETGIQQDVVTNAEGRYQVLYLNPGIYAVTAQLTGFKRFVNAATRVGVSDVVRLDIVLQAGGVEETVTVTADTPLMNTSAISGTTVDARQIAELPLGDGTAYMLSRLAPGIMDTSDLHFSRPADNGNLAGIVANGTQGGNEFKIDGAPNMSNAKGVGFSPPSGAISEFKVQTNAFDAQTGHTAGAVVNLVLKSGTNAMRGEGGYFNRDDSRSATPLLTKRQPGAEKPTREYNRYTGTVGGPIVRNKTFYMGSFERLKDIQPEPSAYTVPTMKMREGDFSEFTTQIFNPFTATGSTRARTAFANNRILDGMINPVARAYAALYPEPNRPGTEDNYFTNQLRPYDYNAFMGRVDHNFNSNNRLYVTGYWNRREEDRYNWAQDVNGGIINGVAVTRGFDYRANIGLTTGYTAVISPSLLLDVRASGARFDEYRDPAEEIDPGALGFSQSALQVISGYKYLPFVTFGNFSTTNANSTIASLGSQRSDWGEGFARPMDTYSVQPTLTKIWRQHTARLGYEYRLQRWDITNAAYGAGRYHFSGFFTRANNSAAENNIAQVWAQFLLGLPNVGTSTVASPGADNPRPSQFEIASPGEFTQGYHGLFLQDDWQLTNRLTLNAGIRFEINTGLRESQNRNIGPFDFASPSPVEAAARAAYALNPMPEISPTNFRAVGGLTFADGAVNETIMKALPRAAGSFLLDDRTVIRAGVGLFSYDHFFENINQTGFSQATPVIVSNDTGLTLTGATLTNPLLGGQLIQPVGSALGLSSQLGQGLGTLYPGEREAPYYTRWEASIQRDFGQGWVASLTYLGSRGRNLPVVQAINNLPTQYLSTLRSRDFANQTFLGVSFPNPFQGLLPGSTINGATIQRSNLLRPYPHFGAFSIERYEGSDRYNAGTIQLQKRFGNGNSISTQYTRSSLRDKLNYLNPMDGQLEDRISPNDRPDRFSLGSVLRLPFGRDERWGRSWNRLTDAALGGWQLSATYQYQSGAPLTWGNVFYNERCGNPLDLRSNIGQGVDGGIAGLDVPAWDISCFYFDDLATPALRRSDQRISLANNVRYFPSTLPHVRTDDIHLLDVGISKNFALPRNMRLQLRLEAINALNYTVLWAPNVTPSNASFGLITTDRNNPRDFQIGLRFTF